MMNHGMEYLARERVGDRLHEAERGRVSRTIPAKRKLGGSWPAKLTLLVTHRLTRVAEAR